MKCKASQWWLVVSALVLLLGIGWFTLPFWGGGVDRETRLALMEQLKTQIDTTIAEVADERDKQQFTRLANLPLTLENGVVIELVNGYPSRESIVTLLQRAKLKGAAKSASVPQWEIDYDVKLEREMVQFVLDKNSDSTYCYIKYFEARPYVAPIVVVDTKGC